MKFKSAAIIGASIFTPVLCMLEAKNEIYSWGFGNYG